MFYTELSAVRLLFGAGLGCRYIRLRVDVAKTSTRGTDAYIPDHAPCLAIRPVDMLEDYVIPPSVPPPPPTPRPEAAYWPPPRPPAWRPRTSTPPLLGLQLGVQGRLRVPRPGRSTPLGRAGSHSGRKSLAQWLWDLYRSARAIARVGQWAWRQESLDAYTPRLQPPRFFGSSPPSIYFFT